MSADAADRSFAGTPASYLDCSSRADRLSGGVRIIPITTAHGTFKVWTKRVGNNPHIKLLLLHGGPGATHEYLWPDPVNRTFKHLNAKVYIPMQGPSELGASGQLVQWDRNADLRLIKVPTMTIGARYDTMDPRYMESMARTLPHGRYLDCPNGSHMAMYDDQQRYCDGLIGAFSRISTVAAGSRSAIP